MFLEKNGLIGRVGIILLSASNHHYGNGSCGRDHRDFVFGNRGELALGGSSVSAKAAATVTAALSKPYSRLWLDKVDRY